jgi:hypothetical protein
VNKQTQSGFAPLMVVIIILSLALVGALGSVFYQGFIQEKDAVVKTGNSSKTNDKETKSPPVTVYDTYKDSKYNFTFQYPNTWSVTNNTDDGTGFATIKDESGSTVTEFAVGTQLGGSCGGGSTYAVIESEPTTIKAMNPVYYSVTGIINDDGSYDAHYGLTDVYTASGSKGKVCSNTFYYTFAYNLNDINALGFANSITTAKHFTNLQILKDYLNSDDYKAIKQMILSLKY